MRFDAERYITDNAENIATPSLVYYKDMIRENIAKAIDMAGGAERLIPHVKSHKMAEMIRLQQEMGIVKFKCATIAEAEMTADCGAKTVLLAYPLIGPAIGRFLSLMEHYPGTVFWAVGDDREQIALLGKEAVARGLTVGLLIDVNMGMNRTGVPMEQMEALYRDCVALEGVALRGLHCYDGHNHSPSLKKREELARKCLDIILPARDRLNASSLSCDVLVMGGTPSFPCYIDIPSALLSPGTLFLQDYGYASQYKDLLFAPGAAVMTRVVSHPAEGLFTLDAGSKAIAADPAGIRGIIAGFDGAEPLFQSEEHWVWHIKEGAGISRPEIGAVLYIIPTHICPTSALYPRASVAENGTITGAWEVTARNRSIGI